MQRRRSLGFASLLVGWIGLVLGGAAPALAIEGSFKVSESAGGVQIWFEAEAFDERCPAPMEIDEPDDHPYFPVVEMEGAFIEGEDEGFGFAVNRVRGEGMLRYTFDIDAADGVGGEWYFWGRVINPGNRSDYMLVEGDPGDAAIPEADCEVGGFPFGNEATFPGGGFSNDDDRIFETNTGDPGPPAVWGWAQPNHEEGHTKILQDGVNSMYMFRREGDRATTFWDVFMWTNDPDYVPTDVDYLDAEVMDSEPPVCPDPPDPDTHCRGVDVDAPEGDLEGTYTFTVDAVDDGGEPIRYLLTADDGISTPLQLSQVDNNVFELVLGPGTWSISVTVDDSSSCDDAAADNTCQLDPIEVLPKPESDFRVSRVGGGVQIWIQAEDFDERFDDVGPDQDPPVEPHAAFPVVAADGAFGDPEANAVNRANGNGMLVYHFDIGAVDGVAGTWYFWGRVINPSNNSDYLLVAEDPHDAEIPVGPPFPGGNEVIPFFNADDRVFEENTGAAGPPAAWGWHGAEEGHIKELRDGQNTMYLLRREGNPAAFWDVFVWADDPAYRPKEADYILAEPMNRSACTGDGDTHCQSFTVSGPVDDSEGLYTVNVEGTDDSGDDVIYTVTADDGLGMARQVSRTGDGEVAIYLTPGEWTLTVSVDDDRMCDDEAADSACPGSEVLEVVPREKRGDFKVSEYGEGVQIWFEAEDFTERYDEIGPDLDPPVEPHAFFPVVDRYGAFHQAVERAGDVGGMVFYEFDIGRTNGGMEGTWYFWGRVINPGNRSDYLLVDGDFDDPVIPVDPPFPGGNGATFPDPDGGPDGQLLDGDDRIFEENTMGSAPGNWGWARTGSPEGHTKELRDGVNDMFLFPRESGNGTVFWDVFMWTDDPGYVPADQDYVDAVPMSIDGENCTNGADDDGDGLTDCSDPDCTFDAACGGTPFVRGDTNADGGVNIADAVFVLSFLFSGGESAPTCEESADINADGTVNISDGVYLLTALFSGGDDPPAPYPECGQIDGVSGERCMSFAACP